MIELRTSRCYVRFTFKGDWDRIAFGNDKGCRFDSISQPEKLDNENFSFNAICHSNTTKVVDTAIFRVEKRADEVVASISHMEKLDYDTLALCTY